MLRFIGGNGFAKTETGGADMVQSVPHEQKRSHRSERNHPNFPIGRRRNPPTCSDHTGFRRPSHPAHLRQLESIANRLLFCRGHQWRNVLAPVLGGYGVGVIHYSSITGILCNCNLWELLANHPDSLRPLPLRFRRVLSVTYHFFHWSIVDELAERISSLLEQLCVERRDDLQQADAKYDQQADRKQPRKYEHGWGGRVG